jgi:ubiquinol-cytochrome c reductase cytochrome b subunit
VTVAGTLERLAGGLGNALDERLGVAGSLRRNARKVFPDHWSFMLGEVALYSFIVLLLSGTFLALFFHPSQREVTYDGGYVPLHGVHMSEAFASTLRISFDVRGGLVIRQVHHWAALIFVAAIVVHLLRVFFTGAFRKPREVNWVIGTVLLTLAIVEGFAGYSLPDDLLSGTGLRIAEGVLLAIPVVGTYLAFFLFGGQFPGEDLVARLYTVHVLLIPGILLALITAHLMILWHQKHTQYPLPGRTETNVVGYPLMPVYIAKAGGFFFIVSGVIALLSAFVQINPVWLFGPYVPDAVSAGSQPDWYMGFLEGALRLFPRMETRAFGFTVSWNVLIPAVVVPGLMFSALGAYPFIEQWATGDRREHHLLDRPHNVPTRTGLGVMALSFYLILLAAGANDILAIAFHLSINAITDVFRLLIVIVPPISYEVTKRICLGLQWRDRETVLHGRETGILLRLPNGGVVELLEPLADTERLLLTGYECPRPITAEPVRPGTSRWRGVPGQLRAKVSRVYFEDCVPPPTPEELQELEGRRRTDSSPSSVGTALPSGRPPRREENQPYSHRGDPGRPL